MIKRSTKLCLEWFAGFLAGMVIFCLALGLRLASGPIELNFLKSPLANTLALSEQGIHWRIEQARLAWDGVESAPQLRIVNLQALDIKDQVIATLPEMAIGLSLRALLFGDLAPGSITLLQPSITIVRNADGHFRMQTETNVATSAVATPGPDLLTGALQSLIGDGDAGIAALRYLRHLEIRGGEVLLDDKLHEAAYWVPKIDLELRRNRSGLSGEAALAIELDEQRTEFKTQLSQPKGATTIAITTQFDHIDIGRIARLVPEFADFSRLRTTISGSLQFNLRPDAEIQGIAINARSDKASLQHERYFPSAIELEDLQMVAHYDAAAGLGLDRLSAKVMGAEVTLSGAARPDGANTRVTAKAEIKQLDLKNLAQLWPAEMAPKPRAWVVPNINLGLVPIAQASFAGVLPGAVMAGHDWQNLEIGQLAGQIEFRDARVDYLSPMPAATGVSGKADIDAAAMRIHVESGQAGGVTLGQGEVVINGLSAVDQDIAIDVGVSGGIADVLRLLDHEPLRLPSKRDFKPEQFGGTAQAQVHLAFPLLNDLKLEQVQVAVKGQGQNISMQNALWGQAASGGDMQIVVTQNELEIAGNAVLADLPFSLLWQEDFRDTPKAARSRYVVNAKGQVESAIQKLAIPLPIPISGIADVDVDYRVAADRSAELLIQADLTQAAVAVLEANYWKIPGQRAAARAEFLLGDGGALRRLRQFSLQAADAKIEGTAEFGAGQSLQRLDVTKLQTPHNDAQIILRRENANSYAINLWGAKFDAGYLWSKPAADDPAERDNYTIDFNLARLAMGGIEDFQGARGRLVLRGPVTESLRLDAKTGDSKPIPFTASITPGGNGRILTARSDDAGAVLRVLNVYDTMRGGKLSLDGVYPSADRDVMNGKLRIDNFAITKATVLAQLLNMSSLTGILQSLGGQGIEFEKLTVDLTQQPGLLTVKTARMNGSSIGIKVGGTIDTKNGRLDLSGTLAPANALNKIVAEIPLIGGILTMGGEQPLFAFNFTVKDQIDNPKISVNPLSALTPGILREVFGGN
jgi:hypothetical protein